MLLPMFIPLFYCLRFKKESFADTGIIFLVMVIIVVIYWPLTIALVTTSNILVKFLLFVFLPILLLLIFRHDKSVLNLSLYGIKKDRLKGSLILGFLFIPIMIIVTFIVKFYIGVTSEPDTVLGVISFLESKVWELFLKSKSHFFRNLIFWFSRKRI